MDTKSFEVHYNRLTNEYEITSKKATSFYPLTAVIDKNTYDIDYKIDDTFDCGIGAIWLDMDIFYELIEYSNWLVRKMKNKRRV